MQGCRTLEPDGRRLSTGRLLEHTGHAWQDLVRCICLRDLARESGEHLVWGGAIPVHEPVGNLLDTLTNGLEPNRNDDRRDDRQPEIRLATATNQRADADRDTDVDGGDECRKDAVDEGSADDDVDVIEAVFQDGNTDCRGYSQHGN